MLSYLIIFVAKIFEVTLGTLRIVMINKGERLYGALFGLVETAIWLKVVSAVLIGIQSDPWKMVFYALGFAGGVYLGSIIEEKLALGLITLQVVTDAEDGHVLAERLRKKNLGVTLLEAEGKDKSKNILLIYIQRKMKDEVIQYIEEQNIPVVISVSELKLMHGGYGCRRHR